MDEHHICQETLPRFSDKTSYHVPFINHEYLNNEIHLLNCCYNEKPRTKWSSHFTGSKTNYWKVLNPDVDCYHFNYYYFISSCSWKIYLHWFLWNCRLFDTLSLAWRRLLVLNHHGSGGSGSTSFLCSLMEVIWVLYSLIVINFPYHAGIAPLWCCIPLGSYVKLA